MGLARLPNGLCMDYRSYIESSEWAAVRHIALGLADFRCRLCNSARSLEVHHRTYERLGHEDQSDLTVLCYHCHRNFHDMLARREQHEARMAAKKEEKRKARCRGRQERQGANARQKKARRDAAIAAARTESRRMG